MAEKAQQQQVQVDLVVAVVQQAERLELVAQAVMMVD
tara:strand:+ start:123 stop:233 length:111 start_codon:yes stop_codon:yes gene_type:complete